MALSSMTGFARSHGVHGTYVWSWELKSVNAKGLEIRLRLPAGWDAVEGPVGGFPPGSGFTGFSLSHPCPNARIRVRDPSLKKYRFIASSSLRPCVARFHRPGWSRGEYEARRSSPNQPRLNLDSAGRRIASPEAQILA